MAAIVLLAAAVLLVLGISPVPATLAAVIVSGAVLLTVACLLLFLVPAHVQETGGATTVVERS